MSVSLTIEAFHILKINYDRKKIRSLMMEEVDGILILLYHLKSVTPSLAVISKNEWEFCLKNTSWNGLQITYHIV